jgi:hypothetical protein
MAELADLYRIAEELPGAQVGAEGLGLHVVVKGKEKGFVWAWNERVHPKQPKVRNTGVLAVVVRSLSEKDIILGSDSRKFFTEDHYNGFPAVLIRLSEIGYDELRDLVIEAWKRKAPKELLAQWKD